ncbi:MAG: hypothetical protein ACO1SV_14735 [Fimbriimonas sp.]
MRKLVPLAALVVVVAVGCKPKLEDQVVGSWSGPNNSTVVVAKEKTWTSDIPAGGMTLKIKGDWTVNGDSITMTPKTVNDQPAAQVAKQMTDMGKKMGLPKAQLDQMNDLVKADDFKLSDDGKTLTLKNPRQGQAVTLTKK